MSRLDDELIQAVEDTRALAPSSDQGSVARELATGAMAPGKQGRRRRRAGLLLALLATGSGMLAVALTSFETAAVYSKSVDELLAQREQLVARNVRVEGVLVPGSLKRRDQPCEYRFRLSGESAQLAVSYPQCVVPDTFRDLPRVEVRVTAEGRLNAGGRFDADRILAKCPSKYDMQERAGSGESVPHRPPGSPAAAATSVPGVDRYPDN